eukprot:CAMPEP_0178882412 /NCGR_PEP_ID=MMETSP0747-20121128/13506_1 /TAXON_ID=913974 /ORGANISM="Nitzschia punctata, Strain CCMP561" /LENGTH=1386 /DNA_ID=CAMNT_0020550417 /DNA_START=22 /DNA_END=4182 /DNA_ORIENTATION=+
MGKPVATRQRTSPRKRKGKSGNKKTQLDEEETSTRKKPSPNVAEKQQKEQQETQKKRNDASEEGNDAADSPQGSDIPQPISSSSSSSSSVSSNDDNEEEGGNVEKKSNTPTEKSNHDDDVEMEGTKTTSLATFSAQRGNSRLFSPYRTLGIVADGPFHLLPNQNSSNAMVCASIGERFHLLQCDKLQPVLVSHAVPGCKKEGSVTAEPGPQKIFHLISDNSLSISVVAHGSQRLNRATRVSLYQRTQPTVTLENLCQSSAQSKQTAGNESSTEDDGKEENRNAEWSIVDLLHLGKIKMAMTGEKQGKKENAALIAVILSKGKPFDDRLDGVPVVGGDHDDSDDESESSSGDDGDEDDNSVADTDERTNIDDHTCRGQVVLLLASRTTLTVHKRMTFGNFTSFCPRVAIHPPTYVNKVILGGSCSKTSRDALVLLNVRTGKMIHVFKCLDKYCPDIKSEITSLEASPAIDTIAVGNSKGSVHLVNTRYDKLLFSLRHQSKSGTKKPVRITSMSFRTDGSALKYGIAPLAVGRSDGTITIWDLSPPSDEDDDFRDDDKIIMGRTLLCEMERVHYPGGVNKLQYLPQEPLLVSTGSHSNAILMHIFDNPDHSGRILRQRLGHTAPPKCIRYLHPGAGTGGGVLANMADGTDAHACQILSTGSTDRTLRKFSTVRSVLDKEFSQGKGLEKRAKDLGMTSKADLLLPPVIALATSEVRTRDWGDLVTIHRNHAFAYVWSSKNGSQSGPTLRQDDWNVSAMKKQPPTSDHATSVAISTCGNFALVGTKGGVIYKYNVQSGMTRGTYPLNKDDKRKGEKGSNPGDIRRTFKELEKSMKLSNRPSNAEKGEKDRVERAKRENLRNSKLRIASHAGHAVTGIAVDSVNRTVISVGYDAKLILWNFSTHTPHKKSPSKLPAPATKLCHVKDSDLAAIALDDYSTVLFDCSALTIVRRFGVGTASPRHTGPISDIGFSPDGRTLYTSSLDGTIRVWDVPTNSCVDWLGFSSSPTSLTVSPTGEYLATTHTGKLGISLWSDRSFYQTVHVDGTTLPLTPAKMDDPAPIAELVGTEESSSDDLNNVMGCVGARRTQMTLVEEEYSKGPARAKEDGLITLSGLPPAHWKNLFHLELVKQRNKPKEPPKKPPSAPFFLQWRPGVTSTGEQSANPEPAVQNEQGNDDEWDAVWSDEDDDGDGTDKHIPPGLPPTESAGKRTRERMPDEKEEPTKKRKVTHYRSELSSLLVECANESHDGKNRFQAVTDYVGTIGPSAIDMSLSSLCNGAHDLEEGLPLLILASRWLIEACETRERFDAVNAYLHRFLHLHSNILAGIDEMPSNETSGQEESASAEQEEINRQRHELASYITRLRWAQRSGTEALQEEMQNSLCLLRHFSRMV